MLNELNNFVYENHFGKRFNSLEHGMYLVHSDLLDYSWNFDVINNRISRFYRPLTTKGLPLVVIGKTAEEAKEARNSLLEIVETDIRALLPGKIYIGEYYTSGFITGSKKSKYLFNERYCNLDLEFTTADPAWFTERNYVFANGNEDNAASEYGVDYPFDYSYDYTTTVKYKKINGGDVGSSKFRIKIYGDAENPMINIGGHIYSVNGTIGQGESLLIDSTNKTITLTTANGQKLNWFDARNRDSYIFEPIPPGISVVNYSGTFGFDLTVVEERSEPKWI